MPPTEAVTQQSVHQNQRGPGSVTPETNLQALHSNRVFQSVRQRAFLQFAAAIRHGLPVPGNFRTGSQILAN